MAKRRRAKTRTVYKTRTVRARARPSYRVKAKRRHSKGMNSELKIALGGFGYGAIRKPLSDLTSMIPFVGGFGDEVGLGIASYLMARGKIPLLDKIKITRDIGRAGLAIESARFGEQLLGGQLSGMFGVGTSSVSQSGIR